MINNGLPLAPEGPCPYGVERRFSSEELELIEERGEVEEMSEEDIEAWVPAAELEFWSDAGADGEFLHHLCAERMRDHELLKELDETALAVVRELKARLDEDPFRSSPHGTNSSGAKVVDLADTLKLGFTDVYDTASQFKPWRVETFLDREDDMWLTIGNHHWLPGADQSARELRLRSDEARQQQALKPGKRSRLSALAVERVSVLGSPHAC